MSLIQRLLAVHDYRVTQTLDPGLLFPDGALTDEHVMFMHGRLYNTFEWMPQLFTEFGVAPGDDFRIEATPEFAHGPVAVCIHGDPRSYPRIEALHVFARTLVEKGTRRLLVFANTEDEAYFGSFFGGGRGTGVACMPQLLGDLAYSLLTATVVYLEFRECVSWKWMNYLWEVQEQA